ncbi:TSUP family transporter [Leucobacter sp. CSA1]|uniref:Probable membrane transporter protein n=1 Tax=Leucobacter chromiisoli TaxID=2796471 RepID=A0A934UWI7_9MICO|nr:TSUP family transporter [Leucobacter chromiisoli]MBK0419957.1 TSUP family transporter [Leucobacter chromiisoli]
MSVTLLAVSCAVVLLAGAVQRITGLGFALTATPALVLGFGPTEGVRLVMVLGIVACALMGATMVSLIDWARSWSLIWPAMLTAPLAAYAAYVSPPAVLMILVGLAAVFALVTAGARGLSRMLRGRAGGLVAGGFAGFLNVTSGLSGPPLVAYAESIRWHPQRFVASLQLVFVAYNLIVLGRGLLGLFGIG